MSRGRIFLAGPFKDLIDGKTGRMSNEKIRLFSALIDFLEENRFEVHSAHKREAWGRKLMTPEQCTRIDFEEIRRCDFFIAFPGAPASAGTHIEMGWASAMGKPIVLLLEADKEYAFLVKGLGEVAKVVPLTFNGTAPDHAQLMACIDSLASVAPEDYSRGE